MADTQSNENNDNDGKPEELLFEILKEVDGFFEQEDRHRFSSRKRMRAIDDTSVSTGSTLIESLRDQLRLSKERIEVSRKTAGRCGNQDLGSHNRFRSEKQLGCKKNELWKQKYTPESWETGPKT